MFESPYHDGPASQFPPRTYQHSPWGEIQETKHIGTGLIMVSTARHGGIWVAPEQLKRMPEHIRSHDGWYEEDCEVAMPLWFFYDELFQVPVYSRERLAKEIFDTFNLEV